MVHHEDEEQEDGPSSESNVASSRAQSKQQSSQNQLVMLVRKLQKEVAILKSASQVQLAPAEADSPASQVNLLLRCKCNPLTSWQ
jgi:hypothetical protein